MNLPILVTQFGENKNKSRILNELKPLFQPHMAYKSRRTLLKYSSSWLDLAALKQGVSLCVFYLKKKQAQQQQKIGLLQFSQKVLIFFK